MATSKIREKIPEDIAEELLAVGLMRRRLHELLTSIERRQDRIIGQLLGVRLEAGLLADLSREHNKRAAARRAVKAVRG